MERSVFLSTTRGMTDDLFRKFPHRNDDCLERIEYGGVGIK